MNANYIKSKFKFLLFLLLIINSCKQRSSDSEIFEKYLEANFNAIIPIDSKQEYILVSSNACTGCYKYLQEESLKKKCNIIFIFSSLVFPKVESDFSNVWKDTTGDLDKLKFHLGNVAKIITEKGEVKSVKVYEPFEMQKIFQE